MEDRETEKLDNLLRTQNKWQVDWLVKPTRKLVYHIPSPTLFTVFKFLIILSKSVKDKNRTYSNVENVKVICYFSNTLLVPEFQPQDHNL